jgi:hypothetical protein
MTTTKMKLTTAQQRLMDIASGPQGYFTFGYNGSNARSERSVRALKAAGLIVLGNLRAYSIERLWPERCDRPSAQ